MRLLYILQILGHRSYLHNADGVLLYS